MVYTVLSSVMHLLVRGIFIYMIKLGLVCGIGSIFERLVSIRAFIYSL